MNGVDVPYGSAQENAAIRTWHKAQKIELLKTISVVTASANPERAQRALNLLIEEMFPSHKIERERAVDKALEIMEAERDRVYSVKKTTAKKSAIGRKISRAFRKKRQR